VAALSWYGVRRGEWWAWIAAVVSPVVGLVVALPYHYTGTFTYDWVTHLGAIYVATLVFVVGALLAPARDDATNWTCPGFTPGLSRQVLHARAVARNARGLR